MKTIEEKAKAYDEVLEKAKKELQACGSTDSDAARQIFRFFPELKLKESEDERIRKALIDYFRWNPNGQLLNEFTNREVFAWLKKQDEHANFLSKIQVGDKVTRNEDGVLVNISQLERVAKPRRVKPADKVEPKFKVGDWIIHHGTENIYQVVAVIDNQYQLKYGDNYSVQKCADVDKCARLYDVAKDAKAGDVLQLGVVTAIFQKYIGNRNCKCYCSVCDGVFEIPSQDGADNTYGCHNAIPTTKEQRDTLMKAMADAGYTFDFEKKELKKIENKNPMLSDFFKAEYERGKADAQKPAEWSEEDEQNLNAVLSYINDEYLRKWFKDTIHKRYDTPAKWSDVDEYMLDETIQHLKELIRIDKAKHFACDVQYYQRDIDWLKSIKQRIRWKPSDEQIKAIRLARSFVTDDFADNPTLSEILIELENQLKKLKD